ncbi:metallophosphoesterase [Deinococcus hopiensis]|uniref:metallophosphoesterase n=1 Tax=Deinococcus hopiensis TaxID=309885 RepID=UPI001FE5C39C|nr:metallophosphoesterase [Deinococcus hopiensis]
MDLRRLAGPFDLIGDVHGCHQEVLDLLGGLDYRLNPDGQLLPPPGRTAVFLGDLTDRGPDAVGVLRLVMGMVEAGRALCVLGNHDEKLRRRLEGRRVSTDNGLGETLEQLWAEPGAFRRRVRLFLDARPAHLLLAGGRLVAAHAGLRADLQGRRTREAWAFAVYGDTTGERDEFGHPVRRDWAAAYGGAALVVYGHTPVHRARWMNNTVNIDTGCAFGGALTALRYDPHEGGEPELSLRSVRAHRVYWPSPSFAVDLADGEQL